MKLRHLGEGVLRTSLLVIACSAFAQDQAMEEVVVTGSLIKGTPEDAALPVEVFTAADLKDVGGPTALEFVKDLTVSGPTTGSTYYFSGAQLNNDVGVNLRGLGADKTLTLFNGRRLGGNTTSAVAGGSANVAMLPGIAISRIEILKDGAAVTYGADATGGVINYITYDNYVGTEIDASYKYYGADGDWKLSALHGFGEGDTNIIVAAEWDHRSELDTKERDFTSLPYGVNPAPWSTLTNLAGWTARSPFGPVNSPDDLVWGGVLGLASDFTQDTCEAVGGIYRDSYTCKYNYVPYYNLVEETDTYRLFFQVNSAVTDSMDFHLQMNWARVHTPHAIGSPAQPVIRGPAENTGATYQFFVPVTNPNVSEFVQRTGFDQNPYWGMGIINGFTPITYRAFAHGGNPTFAADGNFGMPTEIDNRYFHLSTGIDGVFENQIGYDFAVTYNHQTESGNWPDVVGYRLQEALNGFGGPNCSAADLDPDSFGTQNAAAAGTNGCQWWNPFASGWWGQPILGLENPSYQQGTENPDDLVRWIFNPRFGQNILWNATVDLVFDGVTPLELPGGTVAWAVGTQWRTTKLRESVPDPLYN
ncbi:MAG: TonB-dependent receptor plug domain-containing protein, partial [Pseudomonadales bacterium]|nr:TonB-dependent receptor plug domain-containing protein [Pseudomonadales bacterium]